MPETNPERLQLSATQSEPVEKDKTGPGSGQALGEPGGVKKYKKLVQTLVTQGPRKASNATDLSVGFFSSFFPSVAKFSFFVEIL